MNTSFQLLLYVMKVKSQDDQWFPSLNFSDVMWKPLIDPNLVQRILNSTLPPPRLRDAEMPISYTINNLLVNTIVNIIKIINKYDFTILIFFSYLYTTPQACSFNFNRV